MSAGRLNCLTLSMHSGKGRFQLTDSPNCCWTAEERHSCGRPRNSDNDWPSGHTLDGNLHTEYRLYFTCTWNADVNKWTPFYVNSTTDWNSHSRATLYITKVSRVVIYSSWWSPTVSISTQLPVWRCDDGCQTLSRPHKLYYYNHLGPTTTRGAHIYKCDDLQSQCRAWTRQFVSYPYTRHIVAVSVV